MFYDKWMKRDDEKYEDTIYQVNATIADEIAKEENEEHRKMLAEQLKDSLKAHATHELVNRRNIYETGKGCGEAKIAIIASLGVACGILMRKLTR